jgi:hypothetical protein
VLQNIENYLQKTQANVPGINLQTYTPGPKYGVYKTGELIVAYEHMGISRTKW